MTYVAALFLSKQTFCDILATYPGIQSMSLKYEPSSEPSILSPKLEARNHEPGTLNSEPETRTPKPETQNPEPGTLNAKP